MKSYTILLLMLFTSSCSEKIFSTNVFAIDAIYEDTLFINTRYKEGIEVIEYKNHIQLNYSSKLKDTLFVSLQDDTKCNYMEWQYFFLPKEIFKHKDDTLVVEFLPTPLYRPEVLIFNRDKYHLTSAMFNSIDKVYNTIGKEQNYGVELIVFSEKPSEKIVLVLEEIKKYIVEKEFLNKSIITKFIQVESKEHVEILVKPFLVCP